MIARKVSIALPVLRFMYSVTTEIPRFMTAFECIVLTMVDRFTHADRFQDATVPELFDKVLGAQGVTDFAASALEELLSPGVAALVTRNHNVSSARLRLDDLAVTEAGQRYLRTMRLGGTTSTGRRVAAYDLATGVLLDGRVALVEHAGTAYSVAHDAFKQIAPLQDAVCAATLSDSPRGTWIENVHLETPEPERLFRMVQATFGIRGGNPTLFSVRGIDRADTDRLRVFLEGRMAGIPLGDIFGGTEKDGESRQAARSISRFKSRRGKHGKRG